MTSDISGVIAASALPVAPDQMSSVVASLEKTVLQLTSSDNAVRNQAEAIFNDAVKQPEVFLIALAMLVKSSAEITVRGIAVSNYLDY